MSEPVFIKLHADSVQVGFIGVDRGLSGESLGLFRTILDNIEASVDVDDETGEVQFISITGLPLTRQLMCIEKLDGLAEKFGDEEDKSAWNMIREFFGKE